jgi:hypothetical protein
VSVERHFQQLFSDIVRVYLINWWNYQSTPLKKIERDADMLQKVIKTFKLYQVHLFMEGTQLINVNHERH